MSDLFESMTRSERAVAVAKDVINLLTLPANPLIAAHDGYLMCDCEAVDEADDLQTVIPDLLKTGCKVCARGAAMIAKARLFDRVPLYGMVDDEGLLRIHPNDTTSALDGVFNQHQLSRMECAYEMWYVEAEPGLQGFGLQYHDPKDRLIAIMQNVIDHDGDFVVPAMTEEEIEDAWRKTDESLDRFL